MLRRRHPLPAARAYRRVVGSRTMRSGVDELGQRVLVVAFDGWNDAGEAASAAIAHIRESSAYREVFAVDPELYFDYQYTRPQVRLDADGSRSLVWPDATLWRPLHPADGTRLSPRRAFWRAVLMVATLGLLVITSLFSRTNRSLYDQWCGSAVVYDWRASSAPS